MYLPIAPPGSDLWTHPKQRGTHRRQRNNPNIIVHYLDSPALLYSLHSLYRQSPISLLTLVLFQSLPKSWEIVASSNQFQWLASSAPTCSLHKSVFGWSQKSKPGQLFKQFSFHGATFHQPQNVTKTRRCRSLIVGCTQRHVWQLLLLILACRKSKRRSCTRTSGRWLWSQSIG